MIVGVAEKQPERKLFETEMAEEFKANGVEAATSFSVMPKDTKLSAEVLKARALELGCETVLVTHLLGVDDEEMYHPAATAAVSRTYYSGFGYYYPRVSAYVHYPGYYSEHTFVRLETNLYETSTEKLIWSVSSETIDPKTVNEVIDSLCKAVMRNLRKHSLI